MSSHLHTALSRLRRSPYKSLAAILIMSMTLFLASVFFLVAAGSEILLKYFETRPQVNAYFNKDYVPTSAEIEKIRADLESTGQLESFKYYSQDDALSLYKELNTEPELVESVTASMLPASVEVSAKTPAGLVTLASSLNEQDNIDDVRFSEDIVAKLTRWTRSVRLIGSALVGSHVFITFTVILLIIGIKVAERRDEIVILQLVGATPGYIAAPFVWEGILYGIFGALFAWGITYLLLLYSMGFLVSFLSGIPVASVLLPPPLVFMMELLGGELLLGTLVGSVGGLVAVRRFLRA